MVLAAYSAARSWHVTRHMKRQHPTAVEAHAEWSAQPGEQSVPDRMLCAHHPLPPLLSFPHATPTRYASQQLITH